MLTACWLSFSDGACLVRSKVAALWLSLFLVLAGRTKKWAGDSVLNAASSPHSRQARPPGGGSGPAPGSATAMVSEGGAQPPNSG